MPVDLLVIVAAAALAASLSWLYFRRYTITRPPIGVFNLRDVAILTILIATIPYVYLGVTGDRGRRHPHGDRGGDPLLHVRAGAAASTAILGIVAVGVGADVTLALTEGTTRTPSSR